MRITSFLLLAKKDLSHGTCSLSASTAKLMDFPQRAKAATAGSQNTNESSAPQTKHPSNPMFNQPPIPDLQIESSSPAESSILNWNEIEAWALLNHSFYHQIHREAQHRGLSRKDRLRLIVHIMLKENERLVERLIKAEQTNPRVILVQDPSIKQQ